MNNERRLLPELRNPGHIATLTVVALTYVVLILSYIIEASGPDGPPFSLGILLLAIGLGVVYLWLLLSDSAYFTSRFGRYGKAVFFTIAISLMLAIEFLVGGRGGIWLIGMPLVATAVTELQPRWRWVVYAVVVAGMALPIGLTSGDWRESLFITLTFSPAIVFVIVFVRLTQQAEEAQTRSETLAAELESANRALATYAVQAEEMATVQERNRLAREIHDNLGHYLTVVNVQIKAAQAVMDRDPERAATALEKAQQLTQEGLAAVRQSVTSLRESPLGGRSLPEAVAALAADAEASGLICAVTLAGSVRPLGPRTELTLYRAVQEALTNVRKHARASRVDIELNYENADYVTLCIADNGVGAGDTDHTDGFGLLGLKERVRQLNGDLMIETRPRAGFHLLITLPSELAAAESPVAMETKA